MDGPALPGTTIPCTDEVRERLGRIAVPLVRRMVTRKVVALARAERAERVDLALLERAASF